jgi:hypothetical protein
VPRCDGKGEVCFYPDLVGIKTNPLFQSQRGTLKNRIFPFLCIYSEYASKFARLHLNHSLIIQHLQKQHGNNY